MASQFFKLMPKLKFWNKLKKIKHFEIVLVVILALVVLLIWFWDFGDKKETTKESNVNSPQNDYASVLENKLSKVLCEIVGAGSVSVMITLDGTTELVLAYTEDEKINSTENTTSTGTSSKTETKNTSTSPIIVTSNGTASPLVLTEILPNVKGVVVLATGADDIRVKLDILKAVQALLGITSSQVEIFVKS